MTTTTISGDLTTTGTKRERGTFSRMFQRMIEARQRQADRMVSAYLLTMDDRTLAQLGYDRAMLEVKARGATSML